MVRPLTHLLILFLAAASRLAASEPDPASLEFFEKEIRPLFVQHCYECHSVEAGKQKGGLLLDSRWGWETGGDSGAAVKPGDLAASLLMDAVRRTEDKVAAMPPKTELTDAQVASLEKWIGMGAPDPRPKVESKTALVQEFDLAKRKAEHWSWKPIEKAAAPAVKQADWPKNEIDKFILAKIEEAGLRPADDADRRTWLRRVTFDLTGLPPTVEQIRAFLADAAPGAEERVVDGLLKSPQFGEKWARHWLDLVRYAETFGHEFDYAIPFAYEYRDYLIRAFNEDVPYDQLIKEHVAGDLLPNPRRHPTEDYNESIIGTGFWYLHEATHAPTDVRADEGDHIDNQLDVFGKAFLGLTVACARCHDHKFDAISTADYYALSGYLQSSCRQQYPLDPGRQIEEANVELAKLRQDLVATLSTVGGGYGGSTIAQEFSSAVDQLRDGPPATAEGAIAIAHLNGDAVKTWMTILRDTDPKENSPAGFLARFHKVPAEIERMRKEVESSSAAWAQFKASAKLFQGFDGAEIPAGWSTTGPGFQAASGVRLNNREPFAVPGTVDSGALGNRQTGILRSPTFAIPTNFIHVRLRANETLLRVIPDNYQMQVYSQLLFGGTIVKAADSDTKGEFAWRSFGGNLSKYRGHNAYLEFSDSGEGAAAIDEIWFSDSQIPKPAPHPLVRQLALSQVTNAREMATALSQTWHRALTANREGKLDADGAEILNWFSQHGLARIPIAGTKIAEAAEKAAQVPLPRFVTAMAEGTAENAHVHIRGSYANLGEEVPRRFLEALGGEQGNRLTLAGEVANADNPLTSRVLVNRLWHHLFGRGIVPTVDDFGPMGQGASNPALLDWLARDFTANGWSVKKSIRKIVLSRVYRQDSRPHPSLDANVLALKDPNNVLLFHMPVRRLPAESIRDGILATSGGLDLKPYGPSVPVFLNSFMTGRGRPAKEGPLDGAGRRSIYGEIRRNFLPPLLMTFDMPSPFGPVGRRSVSNVPAQALALMNDPFVVGQANRWAKAELTSPEVSSRQRIERMLEKALGQPPATSRVDAMESFLTQQATQYGKLDERAWTDLAQVVFNMKEFVYLR